VAARLLAPVGLTQAKACRRSRFLLNRLGAEGRSLGLRSICRPAGCGRAGEGDLIGDSHRCGCTDTEASLAGPASILDRAQEVIGVVRGIDCHKHRHAAALLDARGGLIDTLLFANRPDGYRELIAWLVEHDATAAIVGIENPAGFGRPLATALAGADFEVLNVPAWRTHRDRRRLGPGKTDPGDAHAIAQVVLRCGDELGPALEPELVRALGLLELQRHRLVRDRTQAIQRLRSTWQQVDPVAEAQTVRCERQRELRRLRRIRFGDALADTIAAGIVRELARDIDALSQRISDLDAQIAALLEQHGNPVADLLGAGNQIAAALIAHAGDVRRLRALLRRRTDPLRLGPNLRPPPPAPRRQPPAQRRLLPHRDRPATPAQCARRPASPDHDYYTQTAARLGGNRACPAVARKLLKRSFHTLRELGEQALAPA